MANRPLVSPDYISWISKTNRAIMCHLYELIPVSGSSAFFTDFDKRLFVRDSFWEANSLRFEGIQRKLNVGVGVDEQTLKIWAKPEDTLFGANFLANAQNGLLDGVTFIRYRAVWRFVTGNVEADTDSQPFAYWPLFTGITGEIVKGGRSHVELKVQSALIKLNVNMPRNYYQPGCNWALFSPGCTVQKSNYATTSTVQAADLTSITPAGGVAPVTGADGDSYYAQGSVLFTTGPNSGLTVLIDNNDSEKLFLAYPLLSQPQVGDGIIYFPGCSKRYDTCDKKFHNKARFRGFDKVPPVVISA